MAVFKCKMCGGSLEVAEGLSVATCEYCGTKQTIPTAKDENLHGLYNRANTLRIKAEFDKAEQLYEKILQSDETQGEAYWGLILCKYGIEYVEDPVTFKRMPTCHRASFDSIIADEDYKAALKYADSLQKSVYEQEAKEIDRIQKEIIQLSSKEEPYDVFICYKETDDTGARTQDSAIANDIYYHLTNEGFKVFYAAITLEDKLGSAYEPCIFSALNSAKVMLAIGTKPEYFNAVWVKNEWSRFLKIIKQDRSKLLIPCYKDIDAYELPEEFAHLQAQDMGKIGFINDVVRGIKKVITIAPVEKPIADAKETVIVGGNASAAPLLERAFMFLEDEDWASAYEYCEKVLDIDPKNATAYLGKLMAELHVKKQEDLTDCADPFDNNNNYQKAVRFADEKLKTVLIDYIEHINTRNENARLDGIYTCAKKAMSVANTESAYIEAAQLFESVSEYLDSVSLAGECYDKAETTRKDAILKAEAERLERERKAEIDRKEAERIAKRNKKIAIITTPIVCAIIAFIIVLNTVIIPNGKYNDAIALIDAGNIVEAYEALVALEGYKDSADKANSIYDKYKVEKLKVAKVGDYVFFGAYEQDNNTSNGKEDVEWRVLSVKDGKALIISKYALDCKPYNTSDTAVTWETCTLRKWLNNDFINAAFSAEEKAIIPTITVSADKNPASDNITTPGNATQDQVFLLSIPEVNKYFNSDSARQCKPTTYALANGADIHPNNGNCCWWMRSPGWWQSYADCIYNNGVVSEAGNRVGNYSNAVRPALWIDLNS